MTKPNTKFKLTVADIELIEMALVRQLGVLSNRRQTSVESTIKPEWELDSVKEIDAEVKAINDLRGRLHNQKMWYRPKNGTYVSG